jgi:hypothetical protein
MIEMARWIEKAMRTGRNGNFELAVRRNPNWSTEYTVCWTAVSEVLHVEPKLTSANIKIIHEP